MSLTFAQLREANVARNRFNFPESKDWTAERWALKLMTEGGELCQAIEKGMIADSGLDDLVIEAGKELADIVTVADLLANRLGIDLGEAVRRKFNIVSDRVNSKVFL